MSYQYIVNTGTIVPDTSSVLSTVQTEFQNAIGATLNLNPNTPQGLLITTETSARTGVIANNAMMANQLNPNLATGTFLRSIGALMGIQDTPTTYSIYLSCTITAQPNSTFEPGALCTNQNGAVFQSTDVVIVNGSGTATVNFQSVTAGAIPVAASDTLTPSSAILGWSGVTPSAIAANAITGTQEMTDYQFRVFRQQALANQSQNMVQSVASKLIALPGVTSVFVRDNSASTQQTINGIVMPPNSIYVCVNDNGGVTTDIAKTLVNCKAPGCQWTASLNNAGTPQTISVTDPSTGQVYSPTFCRSLPVPVFIQINVRNNANMSDLSTAVQDAIIAFANGNVANEQGFVVGYQVSPFDISGTVAAQLPGVLIPLCEVSFDGINWTMSPLAISAWQRPTITATNITVNIVP
jgi:hypothetical protein